MEDIEATMTNVRKAYRLLAEYQQQVLNVVQDIAKEFNYAFYRWQPKHNVANNENIPPFRFGGWGMLPMYGISFFYLDSNHDKKRPDTGQWLLDIYVESDNGYEEKHDKILSPLEFKASVDESDTQIGLYAIQLSKKPPSDDWEEIWADAEYPRDGGKNFVEDATTKTIGKSYNTSELLASEESFKGVIADFKGLLAQNGIQT